LIGHPDSLDRIANVTQIDAIFWAVEPDDVQQSWKLMELAEKMGIRIFVMPSLYTPRVARVSPTYINGQPAMVYRSEPESHLPLLVKAVADKIGAMFGVLVSAPVMLIAALAIKLDSRGPVFFKQTRLGLNGKPFKMLKFRTMYVNAGHSVHQEYMAWFIKSSGQQPRTGREVFKLTNDPRITRPGRILRRTSLDELPQFWNVLRGDMSLVGPRPPLPFEVDQYQPWHRRRVLEAKPGITGLWQVSGRSRTTFDDMVRLDLRYARTYTLWTDIKILAATPRAMFKGAV
jgi:exopolysaccharide biosynthesis polyprenyl glycosylphosphotransferase